MEETIINKIIENKIRLVLEVINKNYPIKFKKENIDKELEYIIKHINIVVTDTNPYADATIKTKVKKLNIGISLENRCCARCWNNGDIFDRGTMKKIKEIDSIFKVIDFRDINIKKFNKKYSLGFQCKKGNIKNSKYCKLHTQHLIHGEYNDIPSKEICYHFMKDGKYL
jgi:hypothetical protein